MQFQPLVQSFDGPSLLDPSPLVIPPFGEPIPPATVPNVIATSITPVTTKKRAQNFVSSSICAAAAAISAARRDCRRVSSWDCVLKVDDGSKSTPGLEEYWFALKVPAGAGPPLAEEEAEDLFFGAEPP